MATASPLIIGLGICNLLLVAAGLLLAYFDWSAARRREFLYIYSAEDRPGAGYFAAARRRRAQYTRLLGAFLVLLLTEFIALLQVSGGREATQTLMWLQCLRMISAPLLGAAFLFDTESPRRHLHDLFIAGFVAAWGVFLALVVGGFLGNAGESAHLVAIVARVEQALVAIFLLIVLWKRQRVTAPGLLEIHRGTLTVAFSAWLLGPLIGLFFQADRALPIEQFTSSIAYAFLAMRVARGVLGEYENVESSRHRMGRERQVILNYLQRIGAASANAIEVAQVLKIILESALETTEASAGAIYLYDSQTGKLEPSVVLNFFPPMHIDTPAAQSDRRTEDLEEEMKHQAFALGEGVVGEVAQNGKPRIIDDVRSAGIMLGTTTDFMRNRSMLLVPLRLRDEPLGVMAVLNKQRGSFGQDDQFLLQALADQGALSISNAMLTLEIGKQERLRRELQIARDIQKMLLPEKCPIVPGFELAARGSSAYEVGGDYYDFFWVDDDRLGIVVADVSGKGVPAALTVAMMRSVFRTQARGNRDVRDVLSQVNRFMVQDLRRSDFITCVYGILDIPQRKFSWARAGHEPLIIAHESAATDVISPDGFALGVIDSPEFDDLLQVETTQLKSGDRLLIFSDGLTEAMNADGEEFGMERILDVMNHAETSNGNGAHGNGKAAASTRKSGENAAAPQTSQDGAKPDLTSFSPCAPESSQDEPDDLKSLDLAVHRHVGSEPQSDDLTIVYLEAK